MKKAICVIILICAIIIGCETETENKTSNPEQERWQGFTVIVVDSCEYLIKIDTHNCGWDGFGYGFMAHKGNCKFCRKRNK